MKYKYSIIIGLTSILSGFIPLSISKNKEITYTIYSPSIVKANTIKEELIVFYKEYCYSSLFDDIDKKISENIDKFDYKVTYNDYHLDIYLDNYKIKMTGYLYKNSLLEINFKSYFTSSTNSIPLATSINVETSALSDQI